MTHYNVTFLNSSNTLYDISVGVNNLGDGYFFTIINFMILLVILVNLKRFDTPQSIYAASSITLLLGGMFYVIGLINIWILGIDVAILLFATIYHWYNSQ